MRIPPPTSAVAASRGDALTSRAGRLQSMRRPHSVRSRGPIAHPIDEPGARAPIRPVRVEQGGTSRTGAHRGLVRLVRIATAADGLRPVSARRGALESRLQDAGDRRRDDQLLPKGEIPDAERAGKADIGQRCGVVVGAGLNGAIRNEQSASASIMVLSKADETFT